MNRPAKEPPLGSATARIGRETADSSRTEGGYRDGTKKTSRVRGTSPPGRFAGTAGRRNPYWLVEDRDTTEPEAGVSTLTDGRRVLPVFGFEEEADLSVRLAPRDGRGVRRIEAGELVSLLHGPFNGVELVALDPLSDAPADVLGGSVGLTRRESLDFLLRPATPAGPGSPVGGGPAGVGS